MNTIQLKNPVVKVFYQVEVKYKTKYKTYITTICNRESQYVQLQGTEIPDGTEINNYEDAVKTLEENDTEDMFYPWTSVVEVKVKRFTKGEKQKEQTEVK